MPEELIDITTEQDVVSARRAGRELARELGFTTPDQTRLATAISELTRNVIQYAATGTCFISGTSDAVTSHIEVTVEDEGPGIEDVQQAMTDGYSTGKGLGAGLPGTKRLVHEFVIDSKPGRTRIKITMIRRRV